MFCKKCGFEFPDDENIRFCKKCGAPVIKPERQELDKSPVSVSEEPGKNTIAGVETIHQYIEETVDDRSGFHRALIVGGIVIVAVVAISLWIVLKPKETAVADLETSVPENGADHIVENNVDVFDPFDLINVTFNGENGSGSCMVNFAQDGDYVRDLSFAVQDYNKDLSNGDKVMINVSYKTNEKDYVSKYNKKLSSFSKEYLVDSLEEPKLGADEMDDLITAFNNKMKGVWASPDENGNPYYVYFDGENNITRYWFSYKTTSVSHIKKITEISENEYRMELECDPFTGSDGGRYDGYQYSSIYESTDGFTSILSVSDDDSEWGYSLARIADDMDEARKLFDNGFNEKYSQIVSDSGADSSTSGEAITLDWITGTWVNPIADPLSAFSEEYHFTFHSDGTVDLDGCRNKDHGTFTINEDGSVMAQFDECYYDTPGEGWVKTEGAKYTVTVKRNGESLDVVFDDECYEKTGSNASNGIYNRQ